MNKNTFEDWFFQIHEGNAAMRCEYFYDDVSVQEERRARLMREWLQAAFEAGQQSVGNK